MKKFVPAVRAAIAVLSLSLAACEDPFGGGRVPIQFTVTDRQATEFAVESASPRTITIRGTFGFTSCREVDPDAQVEGNTLVFRVEMKDSGVGTCPAVIEVRGYRATVSGLDAGTYHVRVEHVGTVDSYDGVNRPDGVRFEGNVAVQ